MHLTDRFPDLDAHALAARFVPPHRFESARFETYIPDPLYPGQQEALASMQAFADLLNTSESKPRFWARNRPARDVRPARYLDGGFGTGKTHLLAALWHMSPQPKAYTTFTELTAFIGFAGMANAIQAFSSHRLICIDEFELDDIANTLMVVSFLRGVMSGGMRLAVTSNTLPDRLGEQRFSASDFRREITAIASYFDEIPVDGPDYRTNHAPLPLTIHQRNGSETETSDDFEEILEHLRRIHPVQYGALLDNVETARINGMRPIADQDAALLFVQFIDKLYDARIPVEVNGCDPGKVFDPTYRNGGYRKKYGRAESRLIAMQAESSGR